MLERFENGVTFFVFKEFNVGEPRFEIDPSDEVSETTNGCLERAA